MCSSDCFLAVMAILFPPLAVWIKRGICSADSIINIALCILGYLPGLVHAWYIIAKYPDDWDTSTYPNQSLDQEANLHRHSAAVYYYQASPANTNPLRPAIHPPAQYSTFQSNPVQYTGVVDTERLPERYTQHEQQTPPQSPAGPSQAVTGEPPSYDSVFKGDHKVQTHD